MNKHRLTGALILAGIILVGVPLYVLAPREPIYHGKPVSRWIDELKIGVKYLRSSNSTVVFLPNLTDQELASFKLVDAKQRLVGRNAGVVVMAYNARGGEIQLHHWPELSTDPANLAIRSIGADALPYLLAKLRKQDSRLADRYRSYWPSLPEKLRKVLPKPPNPVRERANAAYGLGLLGARAKPAWPQLIRTSQDTNDLVRSCVIEALQKIDPAAVPTVRP